MEIAFMFAYIITCCIGVPLHYLHDKYKRGPLVHWIGPVNESTWEHLKLVFFPMLVSFTIARLIYTPLANSLFDVFYGILVAMILIPVLYYPIRYLIKREVVWVSIFLYFVSVTGGFIVAYFTIKKEVFVYHNIYGLIGIILLGILFLIFTYRPPKVFLFKDPVTGLYGDQC